LSPKLLSEKSGRMKTKKMANPGCLEKIENIHKNGDAGGS